MALLKRKPKKTKAQPGKLIVIDGIDGAGKATQCQLLAKTLRLAGFQVAVISFPRYGEKSAYSVERYLQGEHGGDLSPYATAIFYALDRFEASKEIKQWLAEGHMVLIDRYVTANAGHQGGRIPDRHERLKFFKWLDNLEYNIFGIPRPDLILILHMPAVIAEKLLKRKKTTKEDIHEGDLEHLKNAETAFIEIAKLFPNTKLIKSTSKGRLLSPKQIHNEVWELVRRIALRNLIPPQTWLL